MCGFIGVRYAGGLELLPFTLVVFAGSLAAGLVGALTGLGGGIIITPLLVLALGVDMRYAVGASLVAVIATSSGSAAAYLREGYTNVRVAMILEVATVAGAIGGAALARVTPVAVLSAIFGVIMLWTAWQSRKAPPKSTGDAEPDALSTRLGLDSTYPTPEGPKAYRVHHVPAGFAVMFGAGVLSALIGVGSGIIKVLAMDRLMRLPFKVSTTTSNFMIGVTAAASAGVYLHRGQINPSLAAPVALGALGGSWLGARLLPKMRVKELRIGFAVVVALTGIQMLVKGVRGVL